MKVCLAGFKTIHKIYPQPINEVSLLSSFFEWRTTENINFLASDFHLLDSGAFSFMAKGKKCNDKYVNDYVSFINKNTHVFNYCFELDVTPNGYEWIIEVRKYLIKESKLQVIPVWHKSFGIDNFKELCEQYNYIGLGGFVTKEIDPYKDYPTIKKMVLYAQQKGVKIHGLGFTALPWLNKIPFYSVDSTTWNIGGKFGKICVFDKTYTNCKQTKPKNSKVIDIDTLQIHNFNQWVKFSKYAEINL
jgi:hypothetical protein